MNITAGQKLKIAQIARKLNLKLAVVFGSFASGKQRKESDLDIAVSSLEKISFAKQIDLTNELSAVFNKEVDLSILDHANPLLLHQVSENSVLLYGQPEDFFKFKIRAFNAYHDYAPYFALERNLNKKIIDAYAIR